MPSAHHSYTSGCGATSTLEKLDELADGVDYYSRSLGIVAVGGQTPTRYFNYPEQSLINSIFDELSRQLAAWANFLDLVTAVLPPVTNHHPVPFMFHSTERLRQAAPVDGTVK